MTLDAESQELPTAEEAGISLNELAYRRFKQALVTLSYKPGEYLNTAQVMSELDMGRTPINQAIHRLANEMLCMRLASKRITEPQIAALTALNQQIEAASQRRDRVQMMTLDHQFHQQLAQIAGNNMLTDILSVLHARAQRFWASTLSREGHMREVIEEHRAIIAALAAQDDAAAANAAEAHILSFRSALLHEG